MAAADSSWRWWRERRVPAQRVHLDTAAAGRSSVATLAATAAYAEREAAIGAYVAAAEAAPVLAEGRAELARLLGVPPAGLAPPALVHLTQVTSHRALVQPVAAAAALCRAAGVPLWVDAAQALGHVDTACGADAIYATGRKWLTGPRGTGLAGVTEAWWDRLTISASDLVADARPADSSPLWLAEAGEANVAARIGLCTAAGEYVQAGPARIWRRLAEVGRQTRETLAGLPGWAVAGPADAPSAITALRATNGQDIPATRARLLEEYGIVTTAGAVTRAPREMKEPLLRISPHVDCTPEDLGLLREALLALGQTAT